MSAIHRAVSLYSLQDQYARGKMDLEGLLGFVEGLGCEGFEFISDQMMHGTPHPSAETLRSWDRLLGKHHLEPICNDIFINTSLYRNRVLTTAEATAALVEEIKLADRLGFDTVRLVSMTPSEIIEPALEAAERHHVKLALEIHAGMSFTEPHSAAFIEVMKRLDSPYLGLVVDMGIFCRRIPRVCTNYFASLGQLNPEIVKIVEGFFAAGSDPLRGYLAMDGGVGRHGPFPDALMPLVKNEVDFTYLIFCDGYENTDLAVLDEYLPYVTHFHGKFYEMTDDGAEYSIPYDEIVAYLEKKGWSGYIASEYEGQRFVPVDGRIEDLDQVRRHQAMLKRLTGR
jgi:sugar phosphate isomerase/epimerase